MSQLPKSWRRASFDESFTVISDHGKRLAESEYQQQGAFPVIDQGEGQIGGYTDDASLTCHGPFPLIIFGDHTRRVKLVEQPFVVGAQGVKLLAPSPAFRPKFLFYQLPILELPDRGYGRHFQFVRKLEFITAPLPEQDRIVAEIEKQFTRLDDAVAALKRVRANLKRYRASVLKAACEGRLVPTEAELARREGRDYEPASEPLKRILAERRAKWEADQLQKMISAGKPPKDSNWKNRYREPVLPKADAQQLPDGWCWASLDQLGAWSGGGTPSKENNSFWTNGHVPWVSPKDMKSFWIVDSEDRITDEAVLSSATAKVPPGTVLMVTRSGILRHTFPVGVAAIEVAINQDLKALTVAEGIVPEFIAWVLRSFNERILKDCAKDGTTVQSLEFAALAMFAVPLPPTNEQRTIAKALDEQSTKIDHLGRELDAKMKSSSALRNSVLKQAFSGKLVPQDPNDEPASVLLERIRTERARVQEQKQKTPKATNGASPTNGQRRRRVKELAQGVRPGKG